MSNWFVMVTAPSDSGQDWKLIVQKVRLHVLRKIQELLGENIEEYIGVEEVLTPLHFAKHTGSWNGSIYGSSSNGILSAFLRHPNFSKSTKGLYFCGGSVHPGAGIPLCLLSAKIVSELIVKDL